MEQRKYLVELLVHRTMLFLTDGAVEPEVECAANLYGALGEANYDSWIVRINVDLYTPRNEEDVRQLIGVIFHDCFHIYE